MLDPVNRENVFNVCLENSEKPNVQELRNETYVLFNILISTKFVFCVLKIIVFFFFRALRSVYWFVLCLFFVLLT